MWNLALDLAATDEWFIVMPLIDLVEQSACFATFRIEETQQKSDNKNNTDQETILPAWILYAIHNIYFALDWNPLSAQLFVFAFVCLFVCMMTNEWMTNRQFRKSQ